VGAVDEGNGGDVDRDGVDQHRAQVTAEWIDVETGEISRARVRPADRVAVRGFLARFAGQQLEVALEATTGLAVVRRGAAGRGGGGASGRAGGDGGQAGAQEAPED
jgi:hypothetical protein